MKQIVSKKKGTVFLFLFLLSFFSLNLVGAQPPPTTSIVVSVTNGVAIDFPLQTTFEQDQSYHFHFHIFNISTGLRVDNTTTNCSFELFDNAGNHLVDNNDIGFEDDEFEIEVLAGNFSRLGDYHYLVDCAAGNFGGFVSVSFEVTPTGFGDLFDFYAIILLISAVIIIFGFWIRDGWVVILGTFGLYFVGLYILLNGIVGIRDMVTTWAIGLVILAVAAYISIKSGVEMING